MLMSRGVNVCTRGPCRTDSVNTGSVVCRGQTRLRGCRRCLSQRQGLCPMLAPMPGRWRGPAVTEGTTGSRFRNRRHVRTRTRSLTHTCSLTRTMQDENGHRSTCHCEGRVWPAYFCITRSLAPRQSRVFVEKSFWSKRDCAGSCSTRWVVCDQGRSLATSPRSSIVRGVKVHIGINLSIHQKPQISRLQSTKARK